MSISPPPRQGGKSKAQKRAVLFRQQRGRCAICDLPLALASATLDHKIPRAHGGTNSLTNLRVTHKICNNQRGASMGDLFVDLIGLRALRWNVKELP